MGIIESLNRPLKLPPALKNNLVLSKRPRSIFRFSAIVILTIAATTLEWASQDGQPGCWIDLRWVLIVFTAIIGSTLVITAIYVRGKQPRRPVAMSWIMTLLFIGAAGLTVAPYIRYRESRDPTNVERCRGVSSSTPTLNATLHAMTL